MSLNSHVLTETLVGKRKVNIYAAQRDVEGVSGKKQVMDMRVTNNIANAS